MARAPRPINWIIKTTILREVLNDFYQSTTRVRKTLWIIMSKNSDVLDFEFASVAS